MISLRLSLKWLLISLLFESFEGINCSNSKNKEYPQNTSKSLHNSLRLNIPHSNNQRIIIHDQKDAFTVSFIDYSLKVPLNFAGMFTKLPKMSRISKDFYTTCILYCPVEFNLFLTMLRIIELNDRNACACFKCKEKEDNVISKYLARLQPFCISQVVQFFRSNQPIFNLLMDSFTQINRFSLCRDVKRWTSLNVLYPVFSNEFVANITVEKSPCNKLSIIHEQFIVQEMTIESVSPIVSSILAGLKENDKKYSKCKYALPVGVSVDRKPVYMNSYYRNPLNFITYLLNTPGLNREIYVGIGDLQKQIYLLHRQGYLFGQIGLENIVISVQFCKRNIINDKLIALIGLRIFPPGIPTNFSTKMMIKDWKNFVAFCGVLKNIFQVTGLRFNLENLDLLSQVNVDSYGKKYFKLYSDLVSLCIFRME